MLNISLKRINENIDLSKYRAFRIIEERTVSRMLIKVMTIVFVGGIFAMFLPWTQNIRAKGNVTTLSPDDRPQTVQATIGGKIESWYVQEGDIVSVGDTIIRISEVKEEYLDPMILDNTNNQIIAKDESSKAYAQKATNLNQQLDALVNGKQIKLEQNTIKIMQTKLKLQSDSIDLVAADTKKLIALNQLARIENLYNDGLKPLTDLEAKRLSVQEANAKVISLQNKMDASRNELLNLKANVIAITNEYDDKIAKSKSDRMSALSSKYDADASKNKLQSQYNTYEVRQNNYFITSPINGTVTKALKTGIGELIKAGDAIVRIIPNEYKLAVETFIEPMDMPLLEIGQKVRVQFDGWPAIVFSGWPNNSYGTFGGEVFAINNDISDNNKYRILIAPDPDDNPWPNEVRVGGGANTITLLKNVKVGYELWRQLNGFPPDYYIETKFKDVKTKAPLRKVK
ncbi:MAG: HlyD family efflux transporter periplasmic adaptor subunit [Saprospiraceae bacterium]|nr:HlyD family efflux transporter periplasmic adaptor subunit [Saprospiraceae bacterium]